jgi:CheY-like chemotaxis protein
MPLLGTILHVDDSPEDVFLLKHAFKRAEIHNPVQVAVDGQQAIDYLAGRGKFGDRVRVSACLALCSWI